MSFLIDTDVCSASLKGDRRVWGRFVQHAGRLHVSAVTVGERFTWGLRAHAPARRLDDLRDLLSGLSVVPLDVPEARRFGEARAALFDAGTPAPELDLLIAATALVHGLTLVTHNTAHYAHVPGLSLADWLAP